MKFLIFFFLLILNANAQFTESFLVEVKDRSIKVTSPKKKSDVVSIIVTNNTLDKIVSEVRADDKVIRRFRLNPESKEVIQVEMKKVKHLKYLPISPPFEAAELKFNQKVYEIPEKNEKS